MFLYNNDLSSNDVKDDDFFNNNEIIVRELNWNNDVSLDVIKMLDEENEYLPLMPDDEINDNFDFLLEHKKSNIYLNDIVFSKMK